ncbi:MAG: hypothetical protein R3321_07680, partial [Nitrososphaeraceae archaeon]|nr:hypothetical protein [Nitrososphaeraceae archaeon]
MKKFWTIITIMLTNVYLSNGQNDKEIIDPSSYTFIRQNGGEQHVLDYVIRSYADSLNFIEITNEIPHFLIRSRFDELTSYYYNDLFHRYDKKWSISFRELIFTRVYNENALKLIINAKDKRLDQDNKKLEIFYQN